MKHYEGEITVEAGFAAHVVLRPGVFNETERVTVIATADFQVLIETMRKACAVALADLKVRGMPDNVSTKKLLKAALTAAEDVQGVDRPDVIDVTRLRYETIKGRSPKKPDRRQVEQRTSKRRLDDKRRAHLATARSR